VTIIDKRIIFAASRCGIGILLQTALTDLGVIFKGLKEPQEILRLNDRAMLSLQMVLS